MMGSWKENGRVDFREACEERKVVMHHIWFYDRIGNIH